MSMHSTSKRVVVGGLAATAGLATVAAPLATDVAGASGSDGDTAAGAGATPQVLPAPGTYESCTAYFGLFKDNSDLVSYDVKTVGPVAPDPVIGTNLIPILTVEGAGGSGSSVQCIPEPAWTDQASWQGYLDWPSGGFTYPGTGYYLIPSQTGWTFTTPDGPFVVSGTSIRFETDIQATVTWTPAGPPATETGWFPFDTGLTAGDAGFGETLAAITAAGGTQAAVDYAEAILTDGTCDPPDPGATDLAAALSTIFETTIAVDCFDISLGTGLVYRSQLFDLKVERSLVTVTLSNPTPTTTSGAVSGDTVVAPSFTG